MSFARIIQFWDLIISKNYLSAPINHNQSSELMEVKLHLTHGCVWLQKRIQDNGLFMRINLD